jgi:hypothetical protein
MYLITCQPACPPACLPTQQEIFSPTNISNAQNWQHVVNGAKDDVQFQHHLS